VINDPKFDNGSGGLNHDGWMKVLGFTPLNEVEERRHEDWTIQQSLRYGAGFKPGKGDIFGNPD
jgi:hypothetical protein